MIYIDTDVLIHAYIVQGNFRREQRSLFPTKGSQHGIIAKNHLAIQIIGYPDGKKTMGESQPWLAEIIL